MPPALKAYFRMMRTDIGLGQPALISRISFPAFSSRSRISRSFGCRDSSNFASCGARDRGVLSMLIGVSWQTDLVAELGFSQWCEVTSIGFGRRFRSSLFSRKYGPSSVIDGMVRRHPPNSSPCLSRSLGSMPERRMPMMMKVCGWAFMVPMMKCGWRVGMRSPYS